jgi:hypothetical protein
MKDGQPISNIDEAFTYLHNEEDQSVQARLSIPRAQLTDSGTYTLLAQNRYNKLKRKNYKKTYFDLSTI